MLAVQADGARQALEVALRESDGGHLPRGWPDKYESVIGAVLAALEPGERVRAAWRIKNVGRRRMRKGVGLLLVTDRRVLGADQSSKGSGRFAVAVSDVATVALAPNHLRDARYDIVSGWKISLLGEDGGSLGSEDSPAEFGVFTRGDDPSNWDDHVRGEKDLAEVQDSLVQLLPASRASTGESTVMPSAQAVPGAHEVPARPRAPTQWTHPDVSARPPNRKRQLRLLLLAGLAVAGVLVGLRLFVGAPAEEAQREHRAALAPACLGHPVPGAGTAGHASLTSEPTLPNHFVILDSSGKEHEWSGNDYTWRAATVADTELVVCVAADEAFTFAGVCRYEQGVELREHEGFRTVAVFEAATGQEFATFEVAVEKSNSCPPKTWGTAGSSEDVYRRLDYIKDVAPALACLSRGRTFGVGGCQLTE
jgi:hypothetical protein